MNLSDLANIGSLINGAAVLASLIYLSVQVRHARRAQQAAIHQARVERVTNVSLNLAQLDFAKILQRRQAEPRISPRPWFFSSSTWSASQVVALDDAFWQKDAGFLDESSLLTTVLTMKRMMANPVLRAAWHLVRLQVAPAIRERIERVVQETPLVPPVDWATAWQEAYSKVGVGSHNRAG